MLSNIFYDPNGELIWSAVSAAVSAISAVLVFLGVIMNICTQRKIAKQQIDANLKAQARIKWIDGVRRKSSELISLLISLQKEEVAFQEQWLKVEEVSELLKLYFNSNKTKEIASNIYIDKVKRKISIDANAKEKLYNETENTNKHIYIRRYIECLIELYREERYKQILSHVKAISSKLNNLEHEDVGYIMDGITTMEEAKSKLSPPNLEEYIKLKQKLESARDKEKKLMQILVNYNKAVDDFSIIIGLYLKIEWDKAKQGK